MASKNTKVAISDSQEWATAIAEQFRTVKASEGQLIKELVKFGVMVLAQEQFLGSGSNAKGTGLKAWWESREELSEISYSTAMSYKILAERLIGKIRQKINAPAGEVMAALTYQDTYQAPDMAKPAKIDPALPMWRDQILGEYTSKRSLQQYLGIIGKAGRPKGSGGAVRGPDTRTPQQKARELWAPAILQLGDNSTLAYVRYLDDEAARQALDVIEHARKLIMERLATITVG